MGFWHILVSLILLATLPGTSNYKLNSYGFGSGGTAGSSTATYKLEGMTGELNGQPSATTNYTAKSGFIQTEQANVPPAPTLTNPSSYYDKLHLTLNNGGNPTDAKFLIAISSDNFVTDTRYVQSDDTIGSPVSLSDYQTYSYWGGASGFTIIGLAANTTYTVKVKATRGLFTESAFGPTASAATVGQSFTFSLSPNSENLGNLLPGVVTSSPSNVVAGVSTNADNGANVYISGLNAGLHSPTANFTITSATADLSSATTGFGAQSVSATQTSGGPLAAVSPFNGAAQNVGVVSTVLRLIYQATAPITGGQGTFVLKAKASSQTPAASDYSETLTVVGAAVW